MGQSPSRSSNNNEGESDRRCSGCCILPPSILFGGNSRDRNALVIPAHDEPPNVIHAPNAVARRVVRPTHTDVLLQPSTKLTSNSDTPPTSDTPLTRNDEKPRDKRKPGVSIKMLPVSIRPPDEFLSRLVAIDCGMVQLEAAKPQANKQKGSKKKRKRHSPQRQMFLRRVSIVDGTGKELLNEVVKVPPSAVKNSKFQTQLVRQISDHVLPRLTGSSDDLNVGISPHLAKRKAANIVRGRIIVGHSLDNDLKYLGLEKKHEKHLLRDTARYSHFLDIHGNPYKLSTLVKTRLDRKVQVPGKFHCCSEDAIAALDLYLSVWEDFEKEMDRSRAANTEVSHAFDGRSVGVSNPLLTDSGTLHVEALQEKTKIKTNDRHEVDDGQKVPHGNYIKNPLLVILSLPYHLVGDVIRLMVEAPGLLIRALELRLGYVPTPKSGAKRRKRAKRRKERAKRLFRASFDFAKREFILLLKVSSEPLLIFKRVRSAGGIVDLQDHWLIANYFITINLLIENCGGGGSFHSSGRSFQYRLCCLALVYYHYIQIIEFTKRIDWSHMTPTVVRILSQILDSECQLEEFGRSTIYIIAAWTFHLDCSTLTESPLALVLLHFFFFICLSLRCVRRPIVLPNRKRAKKRRK